MLYYTMLIIWVCTWDKRSVLCKVSAHKSGATRVDWMLLADCSLDTVTTERQVTELSYCSWKQNSSRELVFLK